MNETIQTIKTRRSCRNFDPAKMPSQDVLQQIAEAGTWAPTGMGRQSPVIIVVTNRQLRDRISRMNAEILGTTTDPFYGAPCMMIVVVRRCPTEVYDGSTVMQTLMLAARSLGVDSVWIHRAKEEFESQEGRKLLSELGLEGDYIGVGHVALGYAAKELPEPKPRKDGYIRWVK